MPKAAAVSAEQMAIAARSDADGDTLTAQSPYTSTCVNVSMRTMRYYASTNARLRVRLT